MSFSLQGGALRRLEPGVQDLFRQVEQELLDIRSALSSPISPQAASASAKATSDKLVGVDPVQVVNGRALLNYDGTLANVGGLLSVANDGHSHTAATLPPEPDSALVKARIDLTGQAASIGATPIAGTDTAGLYRVSYYLASTVLDPAAGNVTLTLSWTDPGFGGIRSDSVNLAAGGSIWADVYSWVASGSIEYSVSMTDTSGNARYALAIRVEKL